MGQKREDKLSVVSRLTIYASSQKWMGHTSHSYVFYYTLAMKGFYISEFTPDYGLVYNVAECAGPQCWLPYIDIMWNSFIFLWKSPKYQLPMSRFKIWFSFDSQWFLISGFKQRRNQ